MQAPRPFQNSRAYERLLGQDAQPMLICGSPSYSKMWGCTDTQKTGRN